MSNETRVIFEDTHTDAPQTMTMNIEDDCRNVVPFVIKPLDGLDEADVEDSTKSVMGKVKRVLGLKQKRGGEE